MIEELVDSLKNNNDLYYAWQSNIAMSFYDNVKWYKEKNKKKYLSKKDYAMIGNEAAKHFLDLLIRPIPQPFDIIKE